MISPAEKAELFELLWALCEQSLTPEQRDRLEQLVRAHADARQLYAFYMGMVQSLARDQLPRLVRVEQARRTQVTDLRTIQAPVVRDTPLEGVTVYSLATKVLCPPVLRRPVAASIFLIALVVGVMLAAWPFLFTPKNPADDANGRFIATLTGADYCQWGQGSLTTELGSQLKLGTLHLVEGLAEITFESGVTVVLEGPSIFELQSANRAYLHHGKLAAHVPPAGKGFSVQTPGGTVVDLGTEFGLVAKPTGQTEVFAFAGIVEVKPKDNNPDSANKQRLTSGQAIRMSPSETRDIAFDSTPFVRRLPIQPKTLPRVREMREMVSQHPKLMHHYTFEGNRALGEHLQDSKGDVPLREVSFGAGSTAEMKFADGLDPSTVCFTPHRTGPTSGGAALRSVARILLPSRLTVECLVRPLQACGPGYAICTRSAPDQRGYFVTKSAHGPYLATVIGDQLHEIATPVRFVPGDWYYVATTYTENDCTTTLNLYVANVTARQASLTHVGSHEATGTYGSEAYLRIGMGALTRGAPCYAFAGSIDEVALYSDVLGVAELQRRVQILVEDPALVKDGPVTVKPFDDR